MKMKRNTHRRGSRTADSGAMADIAFLLLVFFMVCTVIFNDQGIPVRLPEWKPEAVQVGTPGNIISVFLNSKNDLMVDDVEVDQSNLDQVLSEIIRHKSQVGIPTVISIATDRSSTYGAYLKLYDRMVASIQEFKDNRSRLLFGRTVRNLNKSEHLQLLEQWPIVISERETDVSYSYQEMSSKPD